MPCKFVLLKQTKQPIDRLSDYSGYHFTSFIPNSEIETVKLYTTLWDDADNFGAEKEERRSRKTFRGGERKQILEKTRSEKKKDKREQKGKGGMEKE